MAQITNEESRELAEKMLNVCVGVDIRDVAATLSTLLIKLIMWSLDCTEDEALDCIISNLKLAREQSTDALH